MTNLPQSGGSWTRDSKGRLKLTDAPAKEPAPKPALQKED